jgi:hypothetical protein
MSQSPDDTTIEGEVVGEDAALALPEPIAPAAPTAPATDYTDSGVPTFDYVRDQVERRFTTSTGAAELAADSRPGTSLDEQFTAREQAGKDRLEQIRRAMREE